MSKWHDCFSNIVNCINQTYVYSQKGYAGGIVGSIENGGKIENCINTGKIDIISGDTNNNGISGGIAGLAYKTEINLCVNKVNCGLCRRNSRECNSRDYKFT